MKNYYFFLLLLLIIGSCKGDEMEIESTGSIFVNVRFNGQTVAGTQITTEPATSTVTTDITGSAIISNVPIGGYKVNATQPDIGSGSASVTVTENAVMDVFISLIGGLFESPNVQIQSPNNNSTHNLGADINFSAFVNDSKDPSNTLDLEWSNDLDGVFSNEKADANGNVVSSNNTLSEGTHIITLKATDSDMLEATDQITISVKRLPNAVIINNVEVSENGLTLNWTMSDEPDFANYKITRSTNSEGPFEVIDIISDLNQTTFSDPNLSFGIRYYYQVIVGLNNGDESLSNVESNLYEGLNIDVGVNIVRMKLDPTRPYIYAIDRINNSLLFINKESQSVEKTIFVGSAPTDLDINLDNSKLYIANFGSTQIAVVDLETQEKIDDLFVETNFGWDGNPYRLACMSDNRLVFTSLDQWNSLKLINAETGKHIQDIGSVYYPGLMTNAEKTILYVTESGSSGSSTIRFNLQNDELRKVDESNSISGGTRDACISGNDKFIFYNRFKLLADNLQSNLGSFTETIHACNSDGSIAIGNENIWDANSFSIIRKLPISSSMMLLDSDDETLYTYDNNTSKIYILNIGE